ncbi:1-deoxy-d-xylulose-5-phosphate reductoisomerase 1 [Artemisia annua]|uniref:1-deoxy-d-xylulose-5-phosphate reductoisomerase 1 n=1 Tax=Artemisia annua TaxID=35608 RepID=A0A2U1L5Z8_ARTAN|nr:1-deoxy-d-xylulose-5-phosphate reductoisomerase 1 [Artemisia annua]
MPQPDGLLSVVGGGFSFKKKDVKFAIRKGVRCSAQPSVPPAWPGTALVDPGTKNWDGQKPISIVGSTGSIGTQISTFECLNGRK